MMAVTHRPLCLSDSEASFSGSGLPGPRLPFRAFSRRSCGVLSATASQRLGAEGADHEMVQVPKRVLTPVSSEG